MGEFAKKLHRRMASKADGLPTKEPKLRPGELLPGGIKDVATLVTRAGDQERVAGVAQIVPSRGATRRGNHAQADGRVVVASLRVTLRFVDGAHAERVFVRVSRFGVHVELQIGYRFRIRRPPEGRA